MPKPKFAHIVVVVLLAQVQIATPQMQTLGPPRGLTPEGRQFMQPVWSPTGEWIAVTGQRYDGIWLVKPDGSELQELTADPAVGYKMKWSADGTMLLGRVAKWDKRRRYHAVKVYEVAASRQAGGTSLTDFRPLMPGLPQWAAGNRLVALFADRSLEFFAVPQKRGSQQSLAPERPLVFATPQGVMVASAGEQPPRPPRLVAAVAGGVVNAALAPDGITIAFELATGSLYVCNIDGSQPLDLGRGERPQWSPDGARLAYMISVDDGHRILNADIYVMRRDGTGKINVTGTADLLEMNCSWSPDGRRIVYDERSRGGIWVVELAE